VGRVLFRMAAPIQRFLRTQAASGALLMLAATVALVWANRPLASSYFHLLELPIGLRVGGHAVTWPLRHWINDLLMTLFFLVAGMEIRRELSTGELRTPARAALPLIAALGGMLAPAGVYLLVSGGGATARGWGIPMATDIAFSLGVIGFVKRRVPPSLLVFLTALAIFDDLGAIVIIAVFYGARVAVAPLLAAVALAAALAAVGRARVQAIPPYAALGAALWLALAKAGVHPTLAGVVMGLSLPPTPARAPDAVLGDLDAAIDHLRHRGSAGRDVLGAIERHLEAMQSPLDRTMHGLHGAVAFAIVPAFALVNAGVALNLSGAVVAPVSLGVGLGLFVGKPVGITLATWLGVRAGLAPMPTAARWRDVLGVAMVAGVGFTMSLFVDELAFRGAQSAIDQAKVGVLLGSLASALAGLAFIRLAGRRHAAAPDSDDVAVYVGAPRFADTFRVQAWAWPDALSQQTLADVALRQRFGVTALGRLVDHGARLALVSPDERLAAGTELLLVGEGAQFEHMLRALSFDATRA
jgi:NhaA family Na+:H+ antiporter